MTVLIDYDAGNIKSVEKAFAFLGEDVTVSQDRSRILAADHVVLPGVGSFGSAMERLRSYELIDTIHQVIDSGTPFLGICLGYQLLFDHSQEDGGVEGLGIFKGNVIRFSEDALFGSTLKIPQIGWNSLDIVQGKSLFDGIPQESYVYFVHSYYVKSTDRSIVAATSDYGVSFDAAIEASNVFGCQFHPEKSSHRGLDILRNFLNAH